MQKKQGGVYFNKYYSVITTLDNTSRVQAKTFTNALNIVLPEPDKIVNLFEDLRDGRLLLKIVEYFTNEARAAQNDSDDLVRIYLGMHTPF